MKDFIYGLLGTVICGLLVKGNIFCIILAIAGACAGLVYILKKSPDGKMFYGIALGVILILLLPANFRW